MKKIRLFCLPYAGGSAKEYLKWSSFLNDNIKVIPIELAGRGNRIDEKFYKNFSEMVEDAYKQLKFYIEEDYDYAILGHSMGSWIAFEVCRKIFKSNIKKPIHIFFSANGAPYCKDSHEKFSGISDEVLEEKFINVEGVPKELFDYSELKELIFTLTKNDLELIENYKCEKGDFKIECDISIFNGIYDDKTEEELLGWIRSTSKKATIYNFSGRHLFINECREDVVSKVNFILNKYS